MADNRTPAPFSRPRGGTDLSARNPDNGMVPQSSLRKPRLPVMPLAVLLPPIGELSKLQGLTAQLERRIEEVQSDAGRYSAEEDVELRRKRSAEESMLNQALQWLSVGSGEGE